MLKIERKRSPLKGVDWQFEVSKCKLLHIEQINNKGLLYNIGDYIQSLMINHNGKEYEKECVYIYLSIYTSN